ncbi:Sensory/regulatory protein RpfC [Thalassovita gelatinovora]|uniref:histidine kinase n=1 Tax=Thalassovita gelatinovora TaxID=53501 RepID=A0A0P1F6X9_THAGE|nr:ATP-binding protein [Thalassovita gelatinovora]QIZ79199.1 response regulator [Thalassovita gelatinovora]CUH63688.1 Sensory/regulatory protein RpfC [Thalassovita gelatinovora]SER01587.1 Signal transduction histidine kinase [Thalassovita gelatinovora]
MRTRDIFPSVGSAEDWPFIQALLQKPRTVAIQEILDRKFEFVFLLLITFATALSYVVSNTLTPINPPEMTIVQLAPHPATVLLILGFAIFPTNRLIFFVAAFVPLFVLSSTWAMQASTLILPDTIGIGDFLLLATGFNVVMGITLGMGTRFGSKWVAELSNKITLDVALASTLLVVSALLGLAMSLAANAFFSDILKIGTYASMAPMIVAHMIKGAAIATSLLIIALYPPRVKKIPRYLPLLLLFIGSGLIDGYLGWKTEYVATIILALVLRLILPLPTAITVSLTGILVQSAVLPHEAQSIAQEHMVSAALFLLLSICDLILLKRHVLDQQNVRVQNRLRTSCESAKFGYFVFSADLQRLWIDQNIRQDQNCPLSASGHDTFQRMHPDDAHIVSQLWARYAAEPRQIIVRMSDTAPYSEAKDIHVFRMNFISETSWQFGLVSLGTITDITELHNTSSALEDALHQLEIGKDRQHRLFSLISHELHTPVAILKMLADQMNEQEDWGKLGPRFNIVLDQCLTLMKDLGSAVRDEDLSHATKTPFRPNEFLHHLVGAYRMIAEEAEISVDLLIAPQYNQLRITDVGRLQQVLGNLIRNAVFHSGGQNLVIGYHEKLTAQTLEGIWTIEDNGNGIPDALLPGLFEPFNRQSSGVFSNSDGTGMGMYIVKRFVENLDGSVAYDRSALGGAKFTVTIPLHTEDTQSPTAGPRTAPTKTVLSSLTVALVEDNEMVAEITQRQLNRIFSSVHHALSSEALLDRFETLQPDLVITDIHLPGMDGMELTRTLRERGYNGIIFGLSGAPEANVMTEAGADAVLSKPLDKAKMISLLEDMLQSEDQTAI